jgi:hypothetical protein
MRANDHRRCCEDADEIASKLETASVQTRGNQNSNSGQPEFKLGTASVQTLGNRSPDNQRSVWTQDNQRPIGEWYRMRISRCIRASFLNEYG